MGQTTTKPCHVCGKEADGYSRECVKCHIPYCREHKKKHMTKKSAKEWVCVKCPPSTKYTVTFEGRVRVRETPSASGPLKGFLATGDEFVSRYPPNSEKYIKIETFKRFRAETNDYTLIDDASFHGCWILSESNNLILVAPSSSRDATNAKDKAIKAFQERERKRLEHEKKMREEREKAEKRRREEAERKRKEKEERERIYRETGAVNITYGGATPQSQRMTTTPRKRVTLIKRLPTLTHHGSKLAELGQELCRQMTEMNGPSHWTPMPNGQNDALVEIATWSDEYKEALRHFKKSCNKTVVKIERVQNRYLYQRYLSKKMLMLSKNGSKGINERLLFHGTRATVPNKIWDGLNACGFDPRLGKGFYGIGAYFAEKAKYSASSYAYNASGGIKQIFLASVLTGEAKDFGTATKNTLKRPEALPSHHPNYPGLYDSTKGGPHSGSLMWIVYESQQAYPMYLYSFR